MSSKPLSVEYAKSGKSGCKECKKSIDKGELRVGFVGKANFGATAWYHYDCIWKDSENLKSIDYSKTKEVIQGYDEIRDEDRKKLDKDLPKFCIAAKEKPVEPAAPKKPMAAEYAKSAKSSCKGCSKSIDNGSLRLGFPGKANFGATAWYHYNCIWAESETLLSVGIDSSLSKDKIVQGYGELREDDKKQLDKDLPKALETAKENAKTATKSSTSKKHKMAAEYAKSDKTSCKLCSKNIPKNGLRVGFTGRANFGATAWYHFDCFKTLPGEDFSGINLQDSMQSIVEGLDQLKKDDQAKVEKIIKGQTKSGKPAEAEKRKQDLSENAAGSAPAKKSK